VLDVYEANRLFYLAAGGRGTQGKPNTLSRKLTRRWFLNAATALAAWGALTNTPGCAPTQRAPKVQIFRSRPDLSPPAIEVIKQASGTAPGYIFVAPGGDGAGQGGSMILDDRGEVVWFRSAQETYSHVMNFKVQNYRGRPVLTFGEAVTGKGDEYVILDGSYGEIARLRAGNGYVGDHHEFLISPQDTALFTIYDWVRRDLSPVSRPKKGGVWQGVVQEINIETGEVLFEWHSLEHVGLDETYAKPFQRSRPSLDYFHINSIDVDHDNNLLISARETSAVYKIDRKSGEVMWRLGGKKSDFEMGPGTRFAYQHDARRQADGTITIFDNGTTVFENRYPKAVEESRAVVLELDEEQMRAKLVRQYTHPDKQFAHAGGNMQVLANGNVFVGWGRSLTISEFSKEGELLFDAILPPENRTYRAFRFPWSGQPDEDPAVAAESGSDGKVTVYASWNGATEVASWQALAGPDPERLKPVGSAVPREGFETAITVHAAEPYVAVRAKHGSGEVLGTTEPVKL
jgi:hypothetical protein